MEKLDCLDKRYDRKIVLIKIIKKEEFDEGCVVCGDSGYNNKIFFCRKFKRFKLFEKKVVLRKLGICRKCFVCYDGDGYCRDIFLCRNKDCRREGGVLDYYFFFCLKGEVKRGKESGKDGKCESKLIEE